MYRHQVQILLNVWILKETVLEVFLYLPVMFESGPSGCFQLAPLTGSHQGAAAT